MRRMRNRDLLARVDRRLDVTEGHIRQTEEYIRQGNELVADLHTTLNQWNLRQEKMMREVLAASGEIMTSLREARREGVEEARAQRAALFAILDELKGRGPAAA